jgi:hypothetical protein
VYVAQVPGGGAAVVHRAVVALGVDDDASVLLGREQILGERAVPATRSAARRRPSTSFATTSSSQVSRAITEVAWAHRDPLRRSWQLKDPPERVFLKRMKGLEPSTFCMATSLDARMLTR